MDTHLNPAVLTLLTLCVAAGCGGGDSSSSAAPAPTPPPASVLNDNLLPQTIDPAVTTSFETHVAINPSPSVTAMHRLFVFLPGTGGLPVWYEQILKSAAARGYHAFGENYPNPKPVGLICGGTNALDPDCFWNVRREIITGTDYTPDVTISQPDSIVTRLAEALAYLDRNFPDQGWGQYLNMDGSVDWSKVIVGGHSQGGGHAGVMAKLYALHGACYFDSPADWNILGKSPAVWEGYANLTPASMQYGFTNVDDTLVPYSQLSVIWPQMGLAAFGAAVSVDSTPPPFAGSHMLTTAVTPPSGTGPTSVHSSTVADAATPRNADGTPLFDPVWADMCMR